MTAADDPDYVPPPLYRRPLPLAAVALGGVVGTPARYALNRAFPTPHDGWPTGTFVANLVGAFLLGLLLEALIRSGPDLAGRRLIRLCAGTGFCGAFTTYSALAVETDLLVRAHDLGTAVAYPLVMVVAGLVLTWAGIALGARRSAGAIP